MRGTKIPGAGIRFPVNYDIFEIARSVLLLVFISKVRVNIDVVAVCNPAKPLALSLKVSLVECFCGAL